MLSGILVPSLEVANSRVTSISSNETGVVPTRAVLTGSVFPSMQRIQAAGWLKLTSSKSNAPITYRDYHLFRVLQYPLLIGATSLAVLGALGSLGLTGAGGVLFALGVRPWRLAAPVASWPPSRR